MIGSNANGPRKESATDVRQSKHDGADPGRFKLPGQQRDRDWINRGKPESSGACAEHNSERTMRNDEAKAAQEGEQQSGLSNPDVFDPLQQKRSNPPSDH